MKKKINTEGPRIKEHCKGFFTRMTDEKFDLYENKSDELLEELDALEKECTELCHRAKKQQEYQETLEMSVDPLPGV